MQTPYLVRAMARARASLGMQTPYLVRARARARVRVRDADPLPGKAVPWLG